MDLEQESETQEFMNRISRWGMKNAVVNMGNNMKQ